MRRRTLLKAFGVAGGGLIVGVPLYRFLNPVPPPPKMAKAGYVPNAFLQITPDNQIHFYQPRDEMGQGVIVGMTTLIAEELDVAPEAIRVHPAPVHPAFRRPGSPAQATGGSESMRSHYLPLRQAGANVREAIRRAAAAELAKPAGELELRDAHVHYGGESWPYGRFAEAAGRGTLPADAPLKAPAQFKYIGHARPRIDGLAKSTGTAQFGLDVDFPGLHRAVLRRCPVAGGTLKSARTDAAAAMPGVHRVVTIFDGVAVVAQSTWQAKQAAEKLELEWNLPPLAKVSSAALRKRLEQALERDEGRKASKAGDGAAALGGGARVVEASYFVPYLAHATMEPMNCTVRIADGACEVWTGTQVPETVRGVAAHHAGVPREQVTLHPAFLGGGFGRRLVPDYVAQAAAIARAAGVPVQLVWSREDDMRHDHYRPVAMAKMRAALDAQGRVHAWTAKHAGPNIAPYFIDAIAEGTLPEALPWDFADWLGKRGYWVFDNLLVTAGTFEGMAGGYAFPHAEVRHVTVDPGLPLGYWRSVGHSYTAFFAESFMDELAEAAGEDPVAFRLAHNPPARMQRVIRLAAGKAGWGRAPKGRFQGFAAHHSFNSSVAQVVEISVQDRAVKVHKVTCAVDCGLVVNPDIVRAQMEGSIVYALTAALHGEITLKDGAIEQSNFHDYPMLRMDECPAIDVHVVETADPPTGVGEPGVPPLAPALANAIRAATGKRLRSLPLKLA